jgi:transposase
MSETMIKKMEMTFKKKFEKGLERMRARTPDTYKKDVYRDVIESPIIVDYLKAIKFF